jgi:hypothetical protein
MTYMEINHVRWVPCYHGIARSQVADGEDAFQFWRVAANILNKLSLTADMVWSSSLGVGRGAKKMTQAKENGYEIWYLEC